MLSRGQPGKNLPAKGFGKDQGRQKSLKSPGEVNGRCLPRSNTKWHSTCTPYLHLSIHMKVDYFNTQHIEIVSCVFYCLENASTAIPPPLPPPPDDIFNQWLATSIDVDLTDTEGQVEFNSSSC